MDDDEEIEEGEDDLEVVRGSVKGDGVPLIPPEFGVCWFCFSDKLLYLLFPVIWLECSFLVQPFLKSTCIKNSKLLFKLNKKY